MIKKASVGGRHLKGDNRCVHSWVGNLHLKAEEEGQQYILAALYAILTEGRGTEDAWEAIVEVAERKRREYYEKAGERIMVID